MKLLNNKSFKEIFFSSKGRLGRAETWIYSLGLGILHIIDRVLCYFLLRIILGGYSYLGTYSTIQEILGQGLTIIAILITILLIIMNIFVLIKRAHDLGKRGSRLWYVLIPIYNIYILIKLGFCKGVKQNNEYGAYNIEKLHTITYTFLIIEILIIIGWNIIGHKTSYPYRDRPLTEYIKRSDQHKEIVDLRETNAFDEEAGKEFKNIIDSKLGCDCFGNEATEKPTINIDRKFWDEIYDEFENKLLEMAKDPKYSISDNQSE